MWNFQCLQWMQISEKWHSHISFFNPNSYAFLVLHVSYKANYETMSFLVKWSTMPILIESHRYCSTLCLLGPRTYTLAWYQVFSATFWKLPFFCFIFYHTNDAMLSGRPLSRSSFFCLFLIHANAMPLSSSFFSLMFLFFSSHQFHDTTLQQATFLLVTFFCYIYYHANADFDTPSQKFPFSVLFFITQRWHCYGLFLVFFFLFLFS